MDDFYLSTTPLNFDVPPEHTEKFLKDWKQARETLCALNFHADNSFLKAQTNLTIELADHVHSELLKKRG